MPLYFKLRPYFLANDLCIENGIHVLVVFLSWHITFNLILMFTLKLYVFNNVIFLYSHFLHVADGTLIQAKDF